MQKHKPLCIFVAIKNQKGMNPYILYIEQTAFNGLTYTHSTVRDTYETWKIVCSKSAYKKYGDPKDVASRNWLDEHGEDAYIPASAKLKKFDAEFTFLCNGSASDVKYNVTQFHRFLLGETWYQKVNNISTAVSSIGARLALYDTYNSIGWKDVRLKAFSTDGLVMDNSDNEVILEFKVTFEVFDPRTEVEPMYPIGGGNVILRW